MCATTQPRHQVDNFRAHSWNLSFAYGNTIGLASCLTMGYRTTSRKRTKTAHGEPKTRLTHNKKIKKTDRRPRGRKKECVRDVGKIILEFSIQMIAALCTATTYRAINARPGKSKISRGLEHRWTVHVESESLESIRKQSINWKPIVAHLFFYRNQI